MLVPVFLAVLGCLIAPMLTAAPNAITAQKPTPKRGVIFPNYGPPPASVDELWDSSQLILRGVIQDSHVRRLVPGGRPSVVTDHKVRVAEVLLASSPREKREIVHVLQPAGTMVIDGVQLTVDPGSMPVLAPGQEILVFLTDLSKAGGYSISFGPSGLYILDSDLVALPTVMRPLFGGAKQVSKTEFLAALRARAGKK